MENVLNVKLAPKKYYKFESTIQGPYLQHFVFFVTYELAQ
jgi:hypothetical protein